MFFNKDKRKFVRLPVHHLLKYKIADKQGISGVLSFVRNISAGGTLFHCNERIAPGSILELEIKVPLSTDIIKTKVKVLRTAPLEKMGGFDVAVEFIDLPAATRKAINERILNTHDIEEEVFMKLMAFVSIILAVIAALLGLSIQFNLLPSILFKPIAWLNITNTLLFFSIAFSLLKNKQNLP